MPSPSSGQTPAPPGHADRLAAELVTKGSLRSPVWRHAFATVPRHLFVPAFHVRTAKGTASYTDEAPGWLEAVYRDDTLITRFSDEGLAVSSSTEPSLMALMLENLQLEDGMRVLEIGTGTGYNVALLSERLGSGLVTSLDRDPDLVEQARAALAAAGYRPTVVIGDGAEGYPGNAPYDRLLATCGLGRVPVSWLSQLSTDGMILANVGLGLVRLTRRSHQFVQGPFLPQAAGFMRLRSPLASGVPTLDRVLAATGGDPDEVQHFEDVPGLDDHFMSEFLLSLLLPSGLRVIRHEPGGAVHCVLDGASGAWFRAIVSPDGQVSVALKGSAQKWKLFAEMLGVWAREGRPGIDRYWLTVDRSGEHRLCLDGPRGRYGWDLD